ncbi:MAG: IS605 OrfB-like transposable element containing RNAse H-like and Zn finger domain [Candidatus Methanohalarchaeum thermophilum]|uniref:IS605 OrfB-like transposable element containing RNAse H-like and Zn finger domain n=1 Tax=Methanohalarchaeum thermophilum TaxID=1903181 RepID=A0A1Q6DSD6_METT1|nr:MAG: IS605 OrfB-like transposable element containing RNAse H-like and Zn finger domain [Candidatus Methanohalarchaeum thermophilum]
MNRSLQNTGTIGGFVRFLIYEAELVGKKVVEINEASTTKRCCVCGKKQDMPLHERTYKCDCGNEIDRDKNSAINIMNCFLS